MNRESTQRSASAASVKVNNDLTIDHLINNREEEGESTFGDALSLIISVPATYTA
jgi:hypothetical protein